MKESGAKQLYNNVLLGFIRLANAKSNSGRRDAAQEILQRMLKVEKRHTFHVMDMMTELTEQRLEKYGKEVKEVLSNIAKIFEAQAILNGGGPDEYLFEASKVLREHNRILFPVNPRGVTLQVRRGRVFQTSASLWHGLLNALLEEDRLDLLKSCKICENLYIAKRKDSKTCCTAHAAAWRQRAYYDKHHRRSAGQ